METRAGHASTTVEFSHKGQASQMGRGGRGICSSRLVCGNTGLVALCPASARLRYQCGSSHCPWCMEVGGELATLAGLVLRLPSLQFGFTFLGRPYKVGAASRVGRPLGAGRRHLQVGAGKGAEEGAAVVCKLLHHLRAGGRADGRAGWRAGGGGSRVWARVGPAQPTLKVCAIEGCRHAT